MLFLVFCVAFTSTAETQINQMSYDQMGLYEVPFNNLIPTSAAEIFDSERIIWVFYDFDTETIKSYIKADSKSAASDKILFTKFINYPLLCYINIFGYNYSKQLWYNLNKNICATREKSYTQLGYSMKNMS